MLSVFINYMELIIMPRSLKDIFNDPEVGPKVEVIEV
jgi:hypothetical protein